MREAERPTRDEPGEGNDDERPDRTDPRTGPGAGDHRAEDGGAEGFERSVHGGERAEENEDVDGVRRKEYNPERDHHQRHHDDVVEPGAGIGGGKAQRTE